MAQDIFLKIDGINGESLDDKHKDEIEILNWDWEILQESSMHSGSGGGAGKATVKDLTFEHNIDRASQNLMKYALTGKHIDQAVLVMRKAGGNPLEYLKLTMSDVIVTRVKPSGSKAGEEKSRETVSLSFSKVKQEYVVQNAQGGSGGAVTASFDIKGNKEA
ncbi:Hcp family type VI secretion system effector [Burkholderia multivorans]|uniref:Hcp family type VI secretion system effector n=1 Tax=Burkholderia multivorans TaxID=87883 RepID=UPI0008421CE7|nr:Hcp family type VI secretion system effector [Burkholderia multivorans]AOJ95300.1 Hcp1 family type VI secretion system effector [Burkholderia multivorans]MCO1341943.1 Hcp family type VI secretion system effector [Burkholderia multivorans]MCO1441003.1 Hcp family type VI secretion system effector [Burkholderia multivorans]MDR8751388.1 Protein hcp1 [Burkholderia multivorans]MDR8810445.1 Protein hcp1 [Burkholderia multivorans]